jgi:hypothetical protein
MSPDPFGPPSQRRFSTLRRALGSVRPAVFRAIAQASAPTPPGSARQAPANARRQAAPRGERSFHPLLPSLRCSTAGRTVRPRGRFPRATPPTLAALMLSLTWAIAVPMPPSQAASTTGAVWGLASDFAVAPNQANPNPDQFGNPGVWQFLSATLDHNPANYQWLNEFITNRFGIAGLQGWQGSTVSGGDLDKLPHVSLNTNSDNPRPVLGIDWPPGTVMVHPLPDRAAAVGWRSPINGHVSVAGGVVDGQPQCGDGIDWSIDRGATTLTGGTIPNGGAQAFAAGSSGAAALSDVAVRKGDVLYFLVGPGANRDHACDSTTLDISIDQPKS